MPRRKIIFTPLAILRHRRLRYDSHLPQQTFPSGTPKTGPNGPTQTAN